MTNAKPHRLPWEPAPNAVPGAAPWNAGPVGMPTDRDVWAYVMEWEGDEVVSLLHGRRQGSEFLLAGEDWAYHQVENVMAWVDVEERPVFSLALVRAGIADLERLERHGNGHAAEDWLHREALRAVVAGHPDAQAIAAAALESRAVKFTRYYS